MTGEGRREAAAEELVLAQEEVAVARQLIASGHPRIAMTRAYFATFHAVRALLYAKGYEPRTHTGLQHLFHLHFVRSGQYEPAAGRLLSRLQKYREEADYTRAFVVDEDGAKAELAEAQRLCDRIAAAVGAD